MNKKIVLIVATIMISSIFAVVSFAGQWQKDELGYRFQNDDGTYKTGWHKDVDGQWYYLDTETTYMLSNTVTPDGYFVGESGAWIEGEVVDTKQNNGYENKVELQATAYENPTGAHDIGYSIPVTIYYNNEYTLPYNTIVKLMGVELSLTGVPYTTFVINSDMNVGSLATRCIYHLSDGTTTEVSGSITGVSKEEETYPLLTRIKNNEAQPVSIEIYIGVE